jgi:hypothetical protein
VLFSIYVLCEGFGYKLGIVANLQVGFYQLTVKVRQKRLPSSCCAEKDCSASEERLVIPIDLKAFEDIRQVMDKPPLPSGPTKERLRRYG